MNKMGTVVKTSLHCYLGGQLLTYQPPGEGIFEGISDHGVIFKSIDYSMSSVQVMEIEEIDLGPTSS